MPRWRASDNDGVVSYRLARERTVTADAVRERAPDLILASWCGKKLDPAVVGARPGWADMPAIAAGRLVEIDAAIALQPGPACLSDGVAAIADAIAATAAAIA